MIRIFNSRACDEISETFLYETRLLACTHNVAQTFRIRIRFRAKNANF